MIGSGDSKTDLEVGNQPYQRNEGLNKDLTNLLLWEDQLLDTFGEYSPTFNPSIPPIKDQEEESKSQTPAFQLPQDQVSFDLTVTQPTVPDGQTSSAETRRLKMNEELLMHQINNRCWFYPTVHSQAGSLSEVFKFEESTVAFKVADSNKIYMLQSRLTPFKLDPAKQQP